MELLKPNDVSKILKISLAVLAKMRQDGEGPPYSKIGGSVRYDKEQLIKWVKSQETRRGK